MKCVILTNYNSQYGKELIKELEDSNIPIDAIIVIKQNIKYHVKLFSYVKKRVGLIEALFFSFKLIIENITNKDNVKIKYEQFTSKIIFSNGTNSVETESKIKKLCPDVLILAQTGIVRSNILSIPKFGVLNSHPAILPYYRGIDCHKWAILNNDFDKIGSSIHWVNEGVDTGDIIEVKHYSIKKNDCVKEIEKQLYLLCIKNIKETLQSFVNGKIIKGVKQEKEKGCQYYKMQLKLEKQTKIKLSKFQLKC